MVLGHRSSGRDGTEQTEIHTGYQIRQENYTRYNRLTPAPRHIDDYNIDTVGRVMGHCGPVQRLPPDRANQAGYNPTHFAKAQPPHH
jgi:hypothetical protein